MSRTYRLLLAVLGLLATLSGPVAAQGGESGYVIVTHYPAFGGVDPAPRDAIPAAYGVYNNRQDDYRAVNQGRAEAVRRRIEQETGISVLLLNDWAEVVEGSEALQIVNNVPIQGALYTLFLPPGWTRQAKMAVLLSGNGAGTSNNSRLYGEPDIVPAQIAAFSVRGGRRGLIVAISNCGGTESQGVDEPTLRSVGAFFDFIDANGGDKYNAITAGGSRGGGTALVWAANPLDLDYTVHSVFAAVPPTHYGSLAQTSILTYPSMIRIGELISHDPDAWRYDNDGWNPANVGPYLEILFGTDDPEAANARGPIGLAERLLGKQVWLAAGAHDAFFPLSPFLAFDRRLTELGVHHGTVITLASGHENSRFWMRTTLLYLDLAARGLRLPLPGGRFYYIDVDPRVDDEVSLADFLAERGIDADPTELPVIAQFPYRAGVGNPATIEMCGTPGDAVTLALADAAGQVVYQRSGVIDELECASETITVDLPPGTYYWSLTVNGQVINPYFTPTRGDDGCGLRAVTIVTEEQPAPETLYAFNRDMSFGLDEYSGQPETCPVD